MSNSLPVISSTKLASFSSHGISIGRSWFSHLNVLNKYVWILPCKQIANIWNSSCIIYLGLVIRVTLFVLSGWSSVSNTTSCAHRCVFILKIRLPYLLMGNKFCIIAFFYTFLLKVNTNWLLFHQEANLSGLCVIIGKKNSFKNFNDYLWRIFLYYSCHVCLFTKN